VQLHTKQNVGLFSLLDACTYR